MKSSNKNNRTDFENTWANALNNAEATPNKAVWEGINSELLKADHIRIKGYYKTYRLLAAASVSLLLLASSVFTYFYFSSNTEVVLSETNQTQASEIDKENNLNKQNTSQNQVNAIGKTQQGKDNFAEIDRENQSINKNTITNSDNTLHEELKNIDGNGIAYQANNVAEKETNSKASITTDQDARITQSTTTAFENVANNFNYLISQREIVLLENSKGFITTELISKTKQVDFTTQSLPTNVLPEEEIEIKKAVKDRSKKFYADLNVLTDYFNPNFEVASPQVNEVVIEQLSGLSDNANTTLLGQQNSPTASFSYGINMGVKLSGKWIIEGGISYANYNTQSQSNLSVGDVNNGVTVPVTLLNKPVIANEELNANLVNFGDIYAINNSFEFASIPVRAGYVFGIKKINLILKAGVNTGLFLRNEITANNDSLEPFVNKAGDENSPFRKVHLNGLVSNEVNYALNQNYSFSVAANYRFALNSLTRPGEEINSMPDAYGIGMVVRYHFN